MAAQTFNCRVVTPTEELLNEAVTSATVPAHDGLFGVLPQHAPIVAELGLGELVLEFPDRSDAAGGRRSYFVDSGFAKMAGDELVILAETAVPVENLNETDAQAELAEAEARTVPEDAPDRSAATERLSRERESARLKVRLAKKYRGTGI